MRECEFEGTVSPLTVATVDLKKCVALLSYCNFNSSGACIGANECTVLMKYCQVCCYCQVVLESSFFLVRHFYNFPLLFFFCRFNLLLLDFLEDSVMRTCPTA